MASGHVNRVNRPHIWPTSRTVKKTLAQQGVVHAWPDSAMALGDAMAALGGCADIVRSMPDGGVVPNPDQWPLRYENHSRRPALRRPSIRWSKGCWSL